MTARAQPQGRCPDGSVFAPPARVMSSPSGEPLSRTGMPLTVISVDASPTFMRMRLPRKTFLPDSVPPNRLVPLPSSTHRNVGRPVASTRTVTSFDAVAALCLAAAAASRLRLARAARSRLALAAAAACSASDGSVDDGSAVVDGSTVDDDPVVSVVSAGVVAGGVTDGCAAVAVVPAGSESAVSSLPPLSSSDAPAAAAISTAATPTSPSSPRPRDLPDDVPGGSSSNRWPGSAVSRSGLTPIPATRSAAETRRRAASVGAVSPNAASSCSRVGARSAPGPRAAACAISVAIAASPSGTSGSCGGRAVPSIGPAVYQNRPSDTATSPPRVHPEWTRTASSRPRKAVRIPLLTETMAHLFICPNCGNRTTETERNAGFRREARGCSKCGFGFLFELLDDYYPAPDAAFFACDQQGNVIACGRGSFELTGLDDERVIGRPVRDVLGLAFANGDDPVGTVLEWGVRKLKQPVQVNAEGDLPAQATADLFPAYDDDGGMLLVLTPDK
jgi:predicted RNA-binding Zn-ribbon protein involved in translation (DUF1610 family)